MACRLACKEISIGLRPPSLVSTSKSVENLSAVWILCLWNLANEVHLCVQRALETFTIILAGTQLLCVGSLHAGANAAIVQTPMGVRNRSAVV